MSDKTPKFERGESASAIEITVPSGSSGNRYTAVDRAPPVSTGITARRSGSNAVLVANDRGEVIVERKNSDITIALKNRLSSSTLPSIIPTQQSAPAEPLLGATDALERTGGKGAAGAYSEHMYPLEVLADKYKTHIDVNDPTKSRGLSADKAAELLKEMGPNLLTPPPRVPLWLLFLLQFANYLMVLLQVTALLCIILFIVDPSVLDNLYLGVLLFVVVFITCYETYSQEAKSDQLMAQFRALVPQSASVVRDGNLQPLPVADLVVGDVIRLKSGDKVPADCRVIYNESMKSDQSMITGEAEPVDIQVIAADPNSLEAKNIIFNGSLVVDGGCYAVVIRTGDATLIGTMVELTGDVNKAASTLKADIDYFVKVLTLFALCQAALIFIVGLSRGYNPLTVFIYGFVVIMIGNVPQGLPSTTAASLFLIADRMGKQNVFVKKLDIIETLGSCTLICTDKTGTLTLNQMTVANLWVFGQRFTNEEFEKTGASEKGKVHEGGISQIFRLLEVAALNSRVVLEKKTETSPYEPSGDATELGLYRFFRSCLRSRLDVDIEAFRQNNEKVHEIPFNSSFKWQMSIHRLASEGRKEILFLKGAPDVLLTKCAYYLNGTGQVIPIDEEFRRIYTTAYEDYGGQGERVLGFAMRQMARSYEDEVALNPKYKEELRANLIGGPKAAQPIQDLVFVGLITLLDPPRPEVPQAVRDCHTAGVKVVMVTGDHPLTAAAIARKIGLITLPTRDVLAKERGIPKEEVPEDDIKAVVIHGGEIPAMTEADWQRLVLKKEIVFARTSPEQKLTIVKEFTKAGNVTAMTGDGVNDSPALKQAAIGVAMGLNGSAVAKEAADVVLLDDNFASIVVGIKEGRLLFENLRKSIAYTLAHLTPEVVPVLVWGFGGVVQPMGSLFALCIDLLTELVPATSMALEKPESSIMQRPPRNVKTDRLTSFNLLFYAYFQAGLIITGGCYFTFFRTFERFGVTAEQVMNNGNKFFPADSKNRLFVTNSGDVYDQRDQLYILQRVQAAWYLMIVIGQANHIWNARTTTVSIFEHGLFCNFWCNAGVCIAIGLGCFVVYTPGIAYVVGSHNPFSLEILYASLIVAAVIWPYCEGRKWFTRTYPDHWLNKILAW
jgi:sodium/potassium-transporting ATPase subunit alpha